MLSRASILGSRGKKKNATATEKIPQDCERVVFARAVCRQNTVQFCILFLRLNSTSILIPCVCVASASSFSVRVSILKVTLRHRQFRIHLDHLHFLPAFETGLPYSLL